MKLVIIEGKESKRVRPEKFELERPLRSGRRPQAHLNPARGDMEARKEGIFPEVREDQSRFAPQLLRVELNGLERN